MPSASTLMALEGRTDSDNMILVILSGCVSVFGICSTLTTLFYYRDQQYELNTTESTTRSLLSVLNKFDLVVCVSTVLFLLHGHVLVYPDEFVVPSWYWFFHQALVMGVLVTGFVTFLLVTVRCINTVWCGYLLDWYALIIAVVLFTLLAAGLQLGPYIFNTTADISLSFQFHLIIALCVGIVLVNCVTLSKLGSAESDKHDLEERRHTTLTAVLLSVLYMVTNLGYLAVLLESFLPDLFSLPVLVSLSLIYILLPLKSAVNPLLLLSRDQEMYMWVCNKWNKLATAGKEEEREEREGIVKRERQMSYAGRKSSRETW